MEKKQIKPLYPKIKEMYEQGEEIETISKTLDLCINSIYNAISNMGLPRRRKTRSTVEECLIYADNRTPVFERLIIDGKVYTDITPMFAPR